MQTANQKNIFDFQFQEGTIAILIQTENSENYLKIYRKMQFILAAITM